MRLLVLGGTSFLGRALARAALARGHSLTLFHRGVTGAGLFPEAERIHGDRDGGLAGLAGKQWDAVIDCSGYFPRVVGESSEFLREAVGRYLFVSTISVYASHAERGADETAPVGRLADEATEQKTGETYGPLKALCEEAVQRDLGTRATIVRPGLIVGPHDPTDRFTCWPRRLARGGEILAPGPADDPLQWIDVRDLALFLLELVERDLPGSFDATGPIGATLTWRRFLEEGLAALDVEGELVWASADFLLERGAVPFKTFPLWLPIPEYAGHYTRRLARATEAGLVTRSIAETVRDTWAWDTALTPEERPQPPALVAPDPPSPEQEAEWLEAWRAGAADRAALITTTPAASTSPARRGSRRPGGTG